MEIVKTSNAPQAVGPYSQAVKSGNLLFCSGQIPLNPDGSVVDGDVRVQATQILENIKAVLEAAGTSLDRVVKCTMFLVDINDFAVVNEVYASYFTSENKPARSTIGVAALPKGLKIEIECIAEL